MRSYLFSNNIEYSIVVKIKISTAFYSKLHFRVWSRIFTKYGYWLVFKWKNITPRIPHISKTLIIVN